MIFVRNLTRGKNGFKTEFGLRHIVTVEPPKDLKSTPLNRRWPSNVCSSTKTVTVFGGTGFLGRYVINELCKLGLRVRFPTRATDNEWQHLKVFGEVGQVVKCDFSLNNPETFLHAVQGSDVVVNLLGTNMETRNFSLRNVNVEAAKLVAESAASTGVPKLVHVSCLGADKNSRFHYYQSKGSGEEAIKKAFPSATIVRPALLYGWEDKLLRELARLHFLLPVLPLWNGGEQKMRPAHVHDAALAISSMVCDEASAGKVFHLAGPEVYTFKQLHEILYEVLREKPNMLSLPASLGRLLMRPQEWLKQKIPFPLPASPLLTSEFIDSIESECLPTKDEIDGFAEYSITQRQLNGYTIDYLRTYRAGGYSHGAQQ
mmetsp:Transcript_5822/g.20294  ORF Transcript_5822/g.20294 Transcript_5822/m.20294 type:complete len:373 (-) Transcript_5822:1314-2432(-)